MVLPKIPHSKPDHHLEPSRERALTNETSETRAINLGAASFNQTIPKTKQPLAIRDERGLPLETRRETVTLRAAAQAAVRRTDQGHAIERLASRQAPIRAAGTDQATERATGRLDLAEDLTCDPV
jgi:hypothetical protein